MTAVVHWHSSEHMHEVADTSAKLVVGASVYLGPDAPWDEYIKLYQRVYVEEGLRVLRSDGYFVVIQTDAYRDSRVLPRNSLLLTYLLAAGYELLDEKVWQRRKGDFFQPPFSMVWVFVPPGGTARRPKGSPYLQGIWDYPQVAGGKLNSYPTPLCELIVDSFTEPGDLIVDPFAGSARLLGVASRRGRRAVGYEIDETLRDTVETNLEGQ